MSQEELDGFNKEDFFEQIDNIKKDDQILFDADDLGKKVRGEESEAAAVKNEEIKKLEEELALTKDSLLRKAAELENVRKRVQKERVALYEEAKVAALEDFLPIAEDMKRVVDATKDSELDESFLAGIKLVSSKFEEVFQKYGIERIDQEDVPFDVNLHDALLRQPAVDEETPSDTVIQVLESGYKIGNKVIKHAKVIVSE